MVHFLLDRFGVRCPFYWNGTLQMQNTSCTGRSPSPPWERPQKIKNMTYCTFLDFKKETDSPTLYQLMVADCVVKITDLSRSCWMNWLIPIWCEFWTSGPYRDSNLIDLSIVGPAPCYFIRTFRSAKQIWKKKKQKTVFQYLLNFNCETVEICCRRSH